MVVTVIFSLHQYWPHTSHLVPKKIVLPRSRIPLYDERVKVCFNTAQYPVGWTAQRASHFTPWQTCPFRPQLDFSGKHSTHSAIKREDYSLTFPLLARYSFIQLSGLISQWRERKCPSFETVVKGGFEPGRSRLRVRHSTTPHFVGSGLRVRHSTTLHILSAQDCRFRQ